MNDGNMFIRTQQLQAYTANKESADGDQDSETDNSHTSAHFYITSRIGEIHNYIELIQALDDAAHLDEINIHLATPGGNVDTTIAIIHAINRTCGRVIAHADAGVSSSGTFIFLACNEWRIHDYSYFMFHDGSVSADDTKKFNESKKMIDFVSKLYEQMAHDFYTKIFSDHEIRQILDGSDCYMMGDDVKMRLFEYMETTED